MQSGSSGPSGPRGSGQPAGPEQPRSANPRSGPGGGAADEQRGGGRSQPERARPAGALNSYPPGGAPGHSPISAPEAAMADAAASLGLPILPDRPPTNAQFAMPPGDEPPMGRMPFDLSAMSTMRNMPAGSMPMGAMPAGAMPGGMPMSGTPSTSATPQLSRQSAPAGARQTPLGSGAMPAMPNMPAMPSARGPMGNLSAQAAQQGRSLGVAELLDPPMLAEAALAATAAEAPTEPGSLGSIGSITGAPATSGRAPTLTAQIRSVRPPDVARQAISELGVLAREITALPSEIEESGLARMHKRAYLSVVRPYQELAQEAWLAVAEERLEQTGAEPPYRQRAITIAREVTRLRRESQIAAGNREFPLPRRVPFLWRARTRIIGQELRAWQGRIAIPPDPRRMGQGLLLLRGRLSLAYGGTFEVATLLLIIRLALTLTPIVSVAAALQLVSTLLLGDSLGAATWTAITLLSLLVWMLLLLLTARGRVSLGALLAASVFAPRRSPCNGVSGSRLVAGLLRGWWVLLGALALLAIPVALVISGLSIYALLAAGTLPLPPGSLAQGFAEVGTLVALIVGPLAIAEVGAVLLLAAPLLPLSAWRFSHELAANRGWTPVARRYALEPTLATLAYLVGAALVIVWFIATAFGLDQLTLVTQPLTTGLDATLTWRVVPLALTLALPYLALVELPYRVGLFRWRRAWLHELGVRKANLESHVRRLSAPDPRTGAQDTSDDNLRAMQYDLVLLQFYRDKIIEARAARSGPFNFGILLLILIGIVVGAALLDGGGLILTHAASALH